jgi:hypothetical protein
MGHNQLVNFDEVAKLVIRTGFSCNNRVLGTQQQLIPGYPEKYFARIPIPKNAISMIVGRLTYG